MKSGNEHTDRCVSEENINTYAGRSFTRSFIRSLVSRTLSLKLQSSSLRLIAFLIRWTCRKRTHKKHRRWLPGKSRRLRESCRRRYGMSRVRWDFRVHTVFSQSGEVDQLKQKSKKYSDYDEIKRELEIMKVRLRNLFLTFVDNQTLMGAT